MERFVFVQQKILDAGQSLNKLIFAVSNIPDFFNSFEFALAKSNFLDNVASIMGNIYELRSSTRLKIDLWKLHQQRQADGVLTNWTEGIVPNLMEITQEFEMLADLISTTRSQIEKFVGIVGGQDSRGSDLLTGLSWLLANVANDMAIVEVQPWQLIKPQQKLKRTPKFTLLLRNNNIIPTQPVKATLISSTQARSLFMTPTCPITPGLILLNNEAQFVQEDNSGRLCATFSNLKLKSIVGRVQGGGDLVTKEKYCILFETVVHFRGVNVQIRTISLPMSVQSNISQDRTGLAVIIWDNAFAKMGRLPFEVPSEIEWVKLADAISNKFLSMGGRKLSDDDLQFLFRLANLDPAGNGMISCKQFCQDLLPERQFSLWDWIYATLRLISKDVHIRKMWEEGHLMGCIERDKAEGLLSRCEPGMFLLRFSESVPGAISISSKLVVKNQIVVVSTDPMNLNQLRVTPIPKVVMELDALKWIYPAIPKSNVFENYNPTSFPTSTSKSVIPYKKIKIIIDTTDDNDEPEMTRLGLSTGLDNILSTDLETSWSRDTHCGIGPISFQENCSPPTSQALQLLEIDDSLAACISNHLDMETSYDLLESFLNY